MNTIQNLLLHVSAEKMEPGRGAAAWALGLAADAGAHLTALLFELDVVVPRSAYGQQIAADSRAALEARNRDASQRAAQLQATATERGVEADVITDRSFAYGVPEIVAGHARLHDLVVSGVDHEGLLSERSVAEHLIFESGRPVVVVPSEHDAPFRCERVVVAWDWGRAAARALGDAMPLVRKAREVSIVTFDDDKSFDGVLDEEQLLIALARRGVSARMASAKRGARPIGEALSAFALDQGADLLVMGGYGHSRLRQFILGSATRPMLDRPSLPTLLSH